MKIINNSRAWEMRIRRMNWLKRLACRVILKTAMKTKQTMEQTPRMKKSKVPVMQHEAYTAYMHYATIHCTYITCTLAMKLTPMRNVKVHKKVVIVYHCKPFDLNVCAYNYPYSYYSNYPYRGTGDIKKG